MENNLELNGKTILLVNTGTAKKKFIIQKLKKLGLYLIVLNKEKNWAHPYVDEWILADNFNHNEAIKAVDAYIKNDQNRKIDGVVTFWEDDVLLTSKIVERFNFIGIPYTIAKQVRNKFLFREFCEKNNIKAPKHKLIKNTDDLENIANNFNFPLVIKPAFGASSAFVVKTENKDDLINTYNYIKKNISTETESALSDGLDIFVEEYLDGDEVDIDILLQNGKIKFFTVSDNFNKDWEQFFVDSGQSIPSTLPHHNQNGLVELAEEILEKLGIQNGCIHFEGKATSRGPFPIEVNMRMGGDYVYSYNKAAWDLDLIENSIKICLGQYIKIPKQNLPKKYIIGWDLHPEYSGLLVELNVDDELKRKKYFEEINLYKDVGEPILMPPEGYESLGWLTVSGENFLDAQDNLKDALNYIKYKVVKFDEGSSLGKTSRRNRLSAAVITKNKLIKSAKIERLKRSTLEGQRNLHIGILSRSFENEISDQYSMNEIENFSTILKNKGYKTSIFLAADPIKTATELQQSSVDVVLNLCEEINGSNIYEPHMAAILDLLQIPYTGSDYLALSLCMDKIKMKKLLNYHDIPTANWDYVTSVDEEIDSSLKYPLIVKPSNKDGSVGITINSVVINEQQLREQIKIIINEYHSAALVEEYIEGEEYDACILGNDDNNLRVMPLTRIMFDKMPPGNWNFYPYEMKWGNHPTYNENNVTLECPAKTDKRLQALITEIAIDTYRILGCRDYGRVEFRVDKEGNPFVIEINPNPTLDTENDFVDSAKLINLEYADLIEEIIWLAIEREKEKFIKK
ncbi:MAG: D-alanine-D-alanine ligase-like protein [Candidatus Magasanikbacteria bacterium GW2011_GWC2_37_14]|uniref:D-alanine-D-alanine ligase-like protein n=1 Tax=Candidatus Magasanikbacteria bacterium GW2011_GWC2_37_14 TaxID=1619046 RepID=A0A0G0IT74_9BACT|nr:MAG: D-alanine-D-alanine ligase-like protein [Candidatus Magasanikbacteria bacterium GW2011_GWC2_37_14]